MTVSVFLSYRRDDTGNTTAGLHKHLCDRLGTDGVFIDQESIGLGTQWQAELERRLMTCDYLLAIIGPRWLEVSSKGVARLFARQDPVRREIESAIALGRPLVPVLVDGAAMPTPAALPPSIRALTEAQGRSLRPSNFSEDAESLVELLLRPVSARSQATFGGVWGDPRTPRHRLQLEQYGNRVRIVGGTLYGVVQFQGEGFVQGRTAYIQYGDGYYSGTLELTLGLDGSVANGRWDANGRSEDMRLTRFDVTRAASSIPRQPTDLQAAARAAAAAAVVGGAGLIAKKLYGRYRERRSGNDTHEVTGPDEEQ